MMHYPLILLGVLSVKLQVSETVEVAYWHFITIVGWAHLQGQRLVNLPGFNFSLTLICVIIS